MTTLSTGKKLKITTKGQITLPISWRREHGEPNEVEFITKEGIFQIKPVEKEDEWETIYEAPKNGKGMSGEKFLEVINKSINDKKN